MKQSTNNQRQTENTNQRLAMFFCAQNFHMKVRYSLFQRLRGLLDIFACVFLFFDPPPANETSRRVDLCRSNVRKVHVRGHVNQIGRQNHMSHRFGFSRQHFETKQLVSIFTQTSRAKHSRCGQFDGVLFLVLGPAHCHCACPNHRSEREVACIRNNVSYF